MFLRLEEKDRNKMGETRKKNKVKKYERVIDTQSGDSDVLLGERKKSKNNELWEASVRRQSAYWWRKKSKLGRCRTQICLFHFNSYIFERSSFFAFCSSMRMIVCVCASSLQSSFNILYTHICIHQQTRKNGWQKETREKKSRKNMNECRKNVPFWT